MPVSGVSIKLDEDLKLFVIMELDVKIRDKGWGESMPGVPVQVMRVDKRDIGLQFIESLEEICVLLKDDLNFSADN